MKRIHSIPVVLFLGIVSFGLSELSYENNVFEKTLKPCCNLSHCRYDWDVSCSTISTARIKEHDPVTGEFIGCSAYEYEITCRECVDLNSVGEICDDPSNPPNSCVDAGGSCYGWCNGIWVLAK